MPSSSAERESRRVAEEAREREWRLPSFGKELFLGSFRLDLIHPQPPVDPDAAEKGDAFLANLSDFLEAAGQRQQKLLYGCRADRSG